MLTLTEKFKDEKNWKPTDQATVGEHFQRLVKYKNEGIVVLAGRTELPFSDPNMMGLVIFYAKDDKEALQFMVDDPAVKGKIMQVKVHPYSIALSKCP
ncbi:MAG: YciI family protein [Chitinophagaceae bacterium]